MITDKEPFILTEGEKSSAVWRRLVMHLEDELKNARGKNDGLKLDANDTAALRGQIQILKRLIALGDASPGILPDG